MQLAARDLTLPQIHAYAATVWSELAPGSVVWLSGDLGTGKTAFVQALAAAAAADQARSPTFALVHEYQCPAGLLVHVDCYRLREPDEARDIDFPGLLRDARLLVIEWPERAGAHAPSPDAHFHFDYTDHATVRRLERLR